ncbi:tartrate dehydrogenase [Schinkia azotoformans]|uniref:D-malate dehydrogenase (decarboxylating) n=1 Tax=Schinkia azotoformans LMG 9581 TaxID=1131731 RepID=K6D4N7_SCHAZ|nr:tartrate dehydrogenase [Schinkia azotoformans]EKN63254.1 tartrate dehydrogenase [Schinkia azotoformans LMG 9581]MEC1637196.1 tartrate dehydrogenase [Schinkia azotoformans]MEC1720644.1 tartrate dehydrogenase [Schinkia azotoformans]MEC1943600.1 tartrate dehydrogenase [Schinkia azotoformans]MED4411783.1 tartrate dehydrogenase [Schinkia azotoformans]
MKIYKIAVIAGDGIGPEVVDEGIKVMKKVAELDDRFQFEFTYFPWGCEYYSKYNKMMDEDGLEKLKNFDAIYLGAVGFPGVPDHISLWDLLLRIRKEFDQYVNIRPIKLLNGAPCPLVDGSRDTIDMLFIRENSEGEYAGAGDWLFKGKPEEVVLQTGVFSRKGTERIIRYAFEIASKEEKTLTSISKGNALNYSMVFWDEVFNEVKEEYPDVKTYSYLVDAAAMLMVKDPGRFEVVVTSNLFGDILTDLGAALAGGMGLAAGANINPERSYPSMFEPIHGSAPDIAGKGIANPLAAIWSVSQIFDFLGYEEIGERILKAIEFLVEESAVLTPDLGGIASTAEVGDRVVEILNQNVQQVI